jgi:hypothetical protein
MQKPKPSTQRTFLVRIGALFLVFTTICIVLAAFAPQPDAAALALIDKTPSATYGPSPTPEPAPFCGGFKVSVDLRGFRDGKPIFRVNVTDQLDFDCDGIPNNSDNCDYVANPDQSQSNSEVEYGDACVPESGFRLNIRASEVIIYQMDNGALHLYSPQGEKLGELSRAGMVAINPTLVVKQIMGRTYLIGYTDAGGAFRSAQFQSNALTFGLNDITRVLVTPEVAEVKVGQTAQFHALGIHQSGIQLWFIPRWSATGGTVNSNGVFTAGNTPGEYRVTACRITSPCGSAVVRVVP